MVSPGPLEWTVRLGAVLAAGISVFAAYQLFGTTPGSALRDGLLVGLSALFALTISLTAFAIRSEIDLRDRYRQIMAADISEDSGNQVRLSTNQSFDATVIVDDTTVSVEFPLYRLSTDARRRAVYSPLIRIEPVSDMHAKLAAVERFNFLAETALEVFGSLAGAASPDPSTLRSLEHICEQVENQRVSLENWDEDVEAGRAQPNDEGEGTDQEDTGVG